MATRKKEKRHTNLEVRSTNYIGVRINNKFQAYAYQGKCSRNRIWSSILVSNLKNFSACICEGQIFGTQIGKKKKPRYYERKRMHTCLLVPPAKSSKFSRKMHFHQILG